MAEVVVVTGASAGVGRAVAHAFARRGAIVGLLARGEPGLQAAAREVEELGGSALVVPADVADFEQVDAAADAGRGGARPDRRLGEQRDGDGLRALPRVEPDEFRRATEVTYLGAVHGTMAALRRMVPRDRGTVVQVGSALSYRAIPLQSAYCGAKFAIRGFTDSVRTELMHDGSNVWITMVQLPAVNTPQFSWCRTKLPEPSPAGAADLRARGPRRGHLLGGTPPPARARRRLQRGEGDRRQQDRAAFRRLVSRAHRLSSRSRSRTCRSASGPTISSSPFPTRPRPTGSSTRARRRAATSCGRRRIGGCSPALLAGATGALRLELAVAARADGPRRTSCANTRCSPTANAARSSARTATSRGCASRAGTTMRSSRR